MNPELFKHTTLKFYWDEAGVYETDSSTALDILEHEYIEGIHHIGICREVKTFSLPVNYEKVCPNIIIDFFHFDSINPKTPAPPRHHISSFRCNAETADEWVTRCQHAIRIKYPAVGLLKKIYEYGNSEIKKAMRDLIREANYVKLHLLEADESIWFMSMILGSSEINE